MTVGAARSVSDLTMEWKNEIPAFVDLGRTENIAFEGRPLTIVWSSWAISEEAAVCASCRLKAVSGIRSNMTSNMTPVIILQG
jgi:hypothetical protein